MSYDTEVVSIGDTVTQNKVTISDAAKHLNISRKTLYRWIDKGLLSKHKEGNNSFVMLSEVRALCDRGVTQNDTEVVSGDVAGIQQMTQDDTPKDTENVTVKISYLEGLLVRLGQLESEKRYLLEYKADIEAKDKAIAEAEKLLREKNRAMEQAGKKIQELQAENERLRLPFWRRLFKG